MLRSMIAALSAGPRSLSHRTSSESGPARVDEATGGAGRSRHSHPVRARRSRPAHRKPSPVRARRRMPTMSRQAAQKTQRAASSCTLGQTLPSPPGAAATARCQPAIKATRGQLKRTAVTRRTGRSGARPIASRSASIAADIRHRSGRSRSGIPVALRYDRWSRPSCESRYGRWPCHQRGRLGRARTGDMCHQ
jgi:hypothetical protein